MASQDFDNAAELKRRFPIAPHNSAVNQTIERDGSALTNNVATTQCFEALTVTSSEVQLQRRRQRNLAMNTTSFQIMENLCYSC